MLLSHGDHNLSTFCPVSKYLCFMILCYTVKKLWPFFDHFFGQNISTFFWQKSTFVFFFLVFSLSRKIKRICCFLMVTIICQLFVLYRNIFVSWYYLTPLKSYDRFLTIFLDKTSAIFFIFFFWSILITFTYIIHFKYVSKWW